jgi:uncharacterized protein YehS (DUF1456 family)
MKNNDVLRCVRHAFDISDADVISTFAQADYTVTGEQISDWFKPDDDPEVVRMDDVELAAFLNGFINARRGKKDGAQPAPETELSNNAIFMKLKIALNLQAEAVLEVLALAELVLSKHELSAFFRKPGHKHYRQCKDQVLRQFLKGMQLKHRPEDKEDDV